MKKLEDKCDVLIDAETLTPTAFAEAINEASHAAQVRIEADPEWNTPRWTSAGHLIAAFASAIFVSDEWSPEYPIPDNLALVMARVAQEVRKVITLGGLCEISLIEAERLYWRVCEMPEVIAWNEMKKPFIDLHAMVRNAALYLRTDRREFDQFNAQFEREFSQVKES